MKIQTFKIGTGLVVLALLLLGAGIGAYVWYLGISWDSGTTTVDDPDLASQLRSGGDDATAEKTSAVDILLLGSDSREADLDYNDSAVFRTDTMMLAHIPADRSGIQLVSIPRDAWVQVPGQGEAKINSASAHGGLPLSVETVSDFLGIDIEHVAVLDFAGFWELTDIVGGVDVHSPVAFTSGDIEFTAGLNQLDGAEALAFVRERKAFPDGDLQRIRNQQEFMRAVGSKLMSEDYLLKPAKTSRLIRELSPYLTVDPDLDASTLVQLGGELTSVSEADIDFITAPISGAGWSSDGQQYLKVDQGELKKLKRAFANDTVSEYADEAKEQHL